MSANAQPEMARTARLHETGDKLLLSTWCAFPACSLRPSPFLDCPRGDEKAAHFHPNAARATFPQTWSSQKMRMEADGGARRPQPYPQCCSCGQSAMDSLWRTVCGGHTKPSGYELQGETLSAFCVLSHAQICSVWQASSKAAKSTLNEEEQRGLMMRKRREGRLKRGN